MGQGLNHGSGQTAPIESSGWVGSLYEGKRGDGLENPGNI